MEMEKQKQSIALNFQLTSSSGLRFFYDCSGEPAYANQLLTLVMNLNIRQIMSSFCRYVMHDKCRGQFLWLPVLCGLH